MIEIEAKVRVKNLEETRKKIGKISKFISRERKIDDYYTLQSLSSYPTKSIRIRKLNKSYQINFKNRISYDSGIHSKNEFEFSVGDVEKFRAMLTDMGFKKWLRKEKRTDLYEIKKNFHIEVNKVKRLGNFLEIEYLASNRKEISSAKAQIKLILSKLDINKKELVKDGYTKMLWNKRH